MTEIMVMRWKVKNFDVSIIKFHQTLFRLYLIIKHSRLETKIKTSK